MPWVDPMPTLAQRKDKIGHSGHIIVRVAISRIPIRDWRQGALKRRIVLQHIEFVGLCGPRHMAR
jgi:hypothetical protein